ncbi:sigma-E processing peptidase SpoIIGA [Jeotgalibacillus haloalkalitolerans]|uniref:Sigma-E processing peptidase SpoIIGA n=1 Tax=Jeotgalibacillus haloalkalitolerans TaxID=3104292 RepID=A0ABU5KK09_9BACL|nr:sigma-E processing peptidase SpoIIGA [Jeotgalibacillus sp. HH7-29]MDZ5711573.1 sigma-E processing peptidase SpoIIGA [Jeotgalibacillus sp. HH7-29]
MTLYIEYLLLVNICGGLLVMFAVSKCLRTEINIRSACIILFLYTVIEWLAMVYIPQLSGFLATVSILVLSKYTVRGQLVLHVALILLFIFSTGSMTLYTVNLLNFQSYLWCVMILFILLSGQFILSGKASEWISYSSVQASFICEVTLKQGQSKWTGKGYLDSGNALSAPFSGKPVMFADAQVASRLLPAEVVAYINGQSACPEQWKQRISFIPSKSVHKDCKILLGIECDSVEVESEGQTFIFERIPVIFSKEQYYVEQSCHCLLSPLQMLNCYQK